MDYLPGAIQDGALVELAAAGNLRAFTELYDRHSTLVYSIALKILADHEEASDVVQQVFLKLHRKACLYCPLKGKPAAWLAAMTRNQCIDRLRANKSRRTLAEKLYYETAAANDPGPGREGYAHYADEVDLLHGAMAALRPGEIQVLDLAYFGGLSQMEISLKLAQPLGSIKARIRRALVKLRLSLEGVILGKELVGRPTEAGIRHPGKS